MHWGFAFFRLPLISLPLCKDITFDFLILLCSTVFRTLVRRSEIGPPDWDATDLPELETSCILLPPSCNIHYQFWILAFEASQIRILVSAMPWKQGGSDGVVTLAVPGTGTGNGTRTRAIGGQQVSASVPVQVQCERFYIKPCNSFMPVSVAVTVQILETASVIKP